MAKVFQLYVLAPEAVKVVGTETHADAETGETTTIGKEFTVTPAAAVAVHPWALVPTTL
jgi:hypothetical protein